MTQKIDCIQPTVSWMTIVDTPKHFLKSTGHQKKGDDDYLMVDKWNHSLQIIEFW